MDEKLISTWGNLHQGNSLLKHFVYFNVGFKHVDPMRQMKGGGMK
jgi:hypothetical protein